MNIFFESYFYKDNFLIADAMIIEKLFVENTELLECYKYLAKELDTLNSLRSDFVSKYKLAISFHPYYQLYKNIDDPSRSVKKSKARFIKSTLSFSVSSKSKALIVSSENDNFIYIPRSLKNKKIHVETFELFSKQTMLSIFHTKNPTRGELIPLVEELISLNQKLKVFEKRKIPFTLLENEMCWNRFFSY